MSHHGEKTRLLADHRQVRCQAFHSINLRSARISGPRRCRDCRSPVAERGAWRDLPKLSPLVRELSWTHNLLIMSRSDLISSRTTWGSALELTA